MLQDNASQTQITFHVLHVLGHAWLCSISWREIFKNQPYSFPELLCDNF